MRDRLLNADIIHIATHGKFNATNPLLQLRQKRIEEETLVKNFAAPPPGVSIVLAQDVHHDGYLQPHEITEMTVKNGHRLQAEMVVLSGCETGLGEITEDGIVGFARFLLVAGVPRVIVSLSPVSDGSTAVLMNHFYTNVYDKGWDKAKALTEAMRTTKQKYQDPGKWAAFTLIGLPD